MARCCRTDATCREVPHVTQVLADLAASADRWFHVFLDGESAAELDANRLLGAATSSAIADTILIGDEVRACLVGRMDRRTNR